MAELTYRKQLMRHLATNSSNWRVAMEDELKSLETNQVFDYCLSYRGNKKKIGCRWVFGLKRIVSGKIERFKARLVGKRF